MASDDTPRMESVRVSQSSREDARVAPEVHYERLQRERYSLGIEKQKLQAKLSDLKGEKMRKLKDANLHRLSTSQSIRRNLEIETEFVDAESVIRREMTIIDERLGDLRRRSSEKFPDGNPGKRVNGELSIGNQLQQDILATLKSIERILQKQQVSLAALAERMDRNGAT